MGHLKTLALFAMLNAHDKLKKLVGARLNVAAKMGALSFMKNFSQQITLLLIVCVVLLMMTLTA
jgi:hypothetical protein